MTDFIKRNRGRPSGIRDKNYEINMKLKRKLGRPKKIKIEEKKEIKKRPLRWMSNVSQDTSSEREEKYTSILPKEYNKKMISKDTVDTNMIRKRGRPKGVNSMISSINKAIDIKNGPGTPLFEKGNVPRSPGRPKGSRNKITVALEMMGDENALSVYKKLIELALAGDVNACKIILDRVYPLRKGCKIDLEFDGDVDTVQDINTLFKHVVKMAINGEISPEEAGDYGKVIEQQLKVITDADVMNKIDATCQKVDMIMIKNGK